MAKRSRIDQLLVERGLVESRHKAQALIMAGKVLVNGEPVDKAGREVDLLAEVSIKEGLPFVGRGGLKLSGFLDVTGLEVTGLVAVDVGASTGGFTDCLLQRGAARVYAIDVGKGLIDAKLKADPRVTVLEERNVRFMDPSEIGEKADIAVIDVSFISLEKVLPNVRSFMKEGGRILALIKPQFEVGKGQVGKGGIVRDPEKHRAVVERIREFSSGIGLKAVTVAESSIRGAKGNVEFWMELEA